MQKRDREVLSGMRDSHGFARPENKPHPFGPVIACSRIAGSQEMAEASAIVETLQMLVKPWLHSG